MFSTLNALKVRLPMNKLVNKSNLFHTKLNQQGLVNELNNRPLFDKILIANRGEIAIRVMNTCKKLGIKTVAVYSDADLMAQHTLVADEAYNIGPASSQESYLKGDKLIEVAHKTGAQAIHPGYGFLSENPNFASQLKEEGLVFVGPPSSAMTSMGSKSESKFIMEKAGVPVVPGYHGTNQDPEFLKEKASEIGYPVLIKCIKGGGGKGMRIVNTESEFLDMLNSSKREGMKSFNDDKVLIEKYLTTPRHVEVQVFADTFGNVVHLYERDCSVQRRHQKIIEEAPAPNLSNEIRQELGAKAVEAAKAVNYVGAGTVEFILDNETGKFYFMEMNTRLQVEHPVTEMVTNVDLVQWQLEIASGNKLPLTQDEIKCTGHAFECRIYAENPRNNFLPDIGPLTLLSTPKTSSDVRVETGVQQGDQVSVHYDPMIAKLVVRGRDRTEALRVLRKALKEYEIVGLNTNLEFLHSLASHEKFIEGDVETGFIQKYEKELFPEIGSIQPESIVQACLTLLVNDQNGYSQKANKSLDPFSPWNLNDGFQPNLKSIQTYSFQSPDVKNGIIKVECELTSPSTYKFKLNYPNLNEPIILDNIKLIKDRTTSTKLHTQINDQYYQTSTVLTPPNQSNPFYQIILISNNMNKIQISTLPPNHLLLSNNQSESSVISPMPAKITQVMVEPNQIVKQGDILLILEAMKMEHVIKAPKDGKIKKVKYSKVGMLVPDKVVLVEFEE